jgi:hypothetical protein
MSRFKKFWNENEKAILIGSNLGLLVSIVAISMIYRKDLRGFQVDTIHIKPFEDGTFASSVKFLNGAERLTHLKAVA